MRETAEDFGDNSGMSPRYVFIVSFHICLSQLWANEKMRRLTEKQSCGSVIILKAGDVWRPSYDLLRELVVTWRHSCPYHQWAGLPSGAATSQTWSNCKHTRNSLLKGAVGPSLRHTPRPLVFCCKLWPFFIEFALIISHSKLSCLHFAGSAFSSRRLIKLCT